MRALALLLMMCGCTDVRNCKSGTLLVHVTLDSASAPADQLAVTVSVDGTAYVNPPQSHKPGAASGNLEIDFPSGYPLGSKVVVEVVALLGAAELGHASTPPLMLDAGCTGASLAVVGGSSSSDDLLLPPVIVSDLAQAGDLVSEDDLLEPPDLGGADLARSIDLAGLDLFNCMAATEDCFNGKDDDCDGLVDCDDPDCVGGANPKAICVPDPGTFTAGTLAASCPSGYPLSTAVYQGLSSTCSNSGCSGCTTLSSSFGGPDDCFVLVYAWSDGSCSGGTGYQTRASGTVGAEVCRNDIALGQYHSVDNGYYDGYCNNSSGTSAKNAPQWATSKLFCRGATVGGGCIAGNLCVPKGPSQCVMKTGAGLACPTGYNPQTAWYTGYDDSGRTCQCGCTDTVQGSCAGTPSVTLYTDTGCSLNPASMPNACTTSDLSSYHGAKATGLTISQHATCAPAGYANGSTVATGQQTICCMP